VRLAEAPSYGMPALIYDKSSKGAQAYLQLAKEILDRESAKQKAKQ
jgi:chromosome partitioning protein